VVSESDFETARSRYQQAVARLQAARFQVESAQAQLQDALELLAQTRIFAPMDGTISKLNVELGERVVGTSQMQGTEIMRVARLGQMELEVDVNENDVVNVALQDSATIAVDAYPDRPFRGRVMEIANSARVSNQGTQEQVTNFPVKVRVLDPHNTNASMLAAGPGGDGVGRPEVPQPPQPIPMLRPGMSGTVDIYTETVQDAVAVPIQCVTVRDFNALQSRSQGDAAEGTSSRQEDLRKVVFVAAADTVRMVEVTTGIADDTHIQIRSGLSGGETVVVGPYSAVSRTLEPGDRVRIREEGASADVLASSE
jgi:HlyD family secretion protein